MVVVVVVVVCVVCVVIVMGGRLSVSEHGWDPKKARPKHRVEMLCGDVCESYFKFTCRAMPYWLQICHPSPCFAAVAPEPHLSCKAQWGSRW